MIEFHLDTHSGVAPYLQIVQQVKQALRLGLLEVGDQLPTVREVGGADRHQPQHGAQGLPRVGARGIDREPPRPGHVCAAHPGEHVAGQPRNAAPQPGALAAQRPRGRTGQRERAGAFHVHLSRHPERNEETA